MKGHWVRCSVVLSIGVWSVGCVAAKSVVQADCSGGGSLAATAQCFHLSKDVKVRYDLLSKASQGAVDFETWRGMRSEGQAHDDQVIHSEDCRTDEVLGIRPIQSGEANETIRLVELKRSCVRGARRCTIREARVWREEPEGWRRVTFPKLAQRAGELWNEQRHQEVAPVVESWLKRSPYSMAAHRMKGWALMLEHDNPEERTKHVGAMISLNPRDSQTHLLAATVASSFEAGSQAVAQMNTDDCFRGLAVRNVLRLAKSPKQAMSFIDQINPEGDQFLTTRLSIYVRLGEKERARKLAESAPFQANFQRMKKDKDQGSRRFFGLRIGKQLTKIGLAELAQPWFAMAGVEAPKPRAPGDCEPSIHNDKIKPPQEGLHTAYDMQCRITSRGKYQAGKREGLWVFNHFMSDVKKEEGHYAAGERQGAWKEFNDEGKLEAELNYQNGRKHGSVVMWLDFEAKMKRAEGAYHQGKPHGPWRYYDKDGSTDIGSYENGEKRGQWTKKSKDGIVLRDGKYLAGQPHGDWVYRGSDGTEKSGRYEAGSQVGLWETKTPTGQLLQKILFDPKTKKGRMEEWYADGQRRSVGEVVELKKDGLWKAWFPDGKPQYEGHFKVGKQVGLWKVWFENGQKKAVFNFDEGQGQCWTEEGTEKPCTN